jgi:predicted N-acetyltransferase YhbS
MEMRIRPVGDEELELFVEAAGLPNHQSEIR